jgi:acetoin utilization protein AcuC
MNPARLDLTMVLAREIGLLDGIELIDPDSAGEAELLRIHTPAYIDAVKRAAADQDSPGSGSFGLGTDDNPIFPRMHEAASVIVGGTLRAAQEIATGRATRAVSIGGGMHHAMADAAAGFCVYNDVAVSISWLLDNGFDRIAYVDVDVHHGDGVQRAFEGDPRVLTVSIHQDPATLWPGTGYSSEIGTGPGAGSAVNVPLPPGCTDSIWLRAFHAVVPGVMAAFRPQIVVSQCGVDTHREDPLADFSLTVDGQRAAFVAMRDLADTHAEGRWLAVGGGGYGLIRVVPRAWTHLVATALDRTIETTTSVPQAWRDYAHSLDPDEELPDAMGDEGADITFRRWGGPGEPSEIEEHDVDDVVRADAAILATRRAVFPILGLDPDDPSD